MNDSKISVRYSRALFDSAVERNQLDRVYQDMIFIYGLCTLPDVKELLESPIITPSKKKEIFHKIAASEIQEITLALLDLVLKNGREKFLPAITREFIRVTKEHKGITEAVLTTAVAVDDKIKKQITDFMAGIFRTKIELTEIIDREIIGGFILKAEDKYIDASIRNKLRRIEKELKEKTLTA